MAAVALAALLVALSTGAPPWTATLLALGNGGAMALAAATLRRFGMHPALDRRHDLRLLALGAVGAAALTASNGVFWLILGGALPLSAAPRAWAYWWLGDLMGVIVVGVPLLTISRHTLARLLSPGLRSAALAAGTLLSTWLAFRGEAGGVSPLLFLPICCSAGWPCARACSRPRSRCC